MSRQSDVQPVVAYLRARGIEPEIRHGGKHILLVFHTPDGRRHSLPFSYAGRRKGRGWRASHKTLTKINRLI